MPELVYAARHYPGTGRRVHAVEHGCSSLHPGETYQADGPLDDVTCCECRARLRDAGLLPPTNLARRRKADA